MLENESVLKSLHVFPRMLEGCLAFDRRWSVDLSPDAAHSLTRGEV